MSFDDTTVKWDSTLLTFDEDEKFLKWYQINYDATFPPNAVIEEDENAGILDYDFHRAGNASPDQVGYVYASSGWSPPGTFTHVTFAAAKGVLENEDTDDAKKWMDVIEALYGPSTDP